MSGSYEAVHNAICRRIQISHLDLVMKYGIDAVKQEIDFKASSFDGEQLEEIGTSDVSCWVKDIEEALERSHKPR